MKLTLLLAAHSLRIDVLKRGRKVNVAVKAAIFDAEILQRGCKHDGFDPDYMAFCPDCGKDLRETSSREATGSSHEGEEVTQQ